jgi:antitoxin component YwqK of YwqJK toxin-antitoxin module
MDSLPIEIIEMIFMFVNPKDYTNFILSYDIALYFWRNKKTRKKYKEQYLQVIRGNFRYKPEMYFVYYIRIDNGKNHGKYTSYYKNGQIRVDIAYQNGKRHGKYIEYYENGQLCINTTYQNDQMHGKYIKYYESGKIQINTTYQNGKRHGKYTSHYKNGQICEDLTY